MPALLGSAGCEYRMLIRAWWLWAAIAVAGIASTRLAGIPLSTQLIWPARAEVGVYAVNFNLVVPLIAGLALAGRAGRDRRLGLAELLESTGSRRGARLWGRFLGAAAAVSTQALASWLVVLLVIAAQRRSGLPLAWGLAAFAAVLLPGLIFITAVSLAGAAVLTPALYRVLLAGYWFWGNLMPPRLMPTLAATPLLPLGSYAADGLFARDLPGGLAGLSYLLRDARSAAQAGASIGLLLVAAVAAVAALQLTEARRARAGLTGPGDRMDVTLRGIRKTYRGGITALDRLDLDIPPGLFGLLGPSGGGKTTLMRILAGVSRPDRGSVRAGGWDLGRPRERRQFQGRLGYLPRDLGLYPELSGRRFLDYAGTLKGMSSPRRRHRRVDEVLALTGLDAVADRPAGGYSGGMRRRLGMAQALLNDPAVLLLDEPTAGLDPQEQARIRVLLVSLAGQRTVVLATRDVRDVSSTCGRCAVLAGGRVIFQGDTAGLARVADGLVWSVQTDRPLSAAQAAAVVSAVRLPDRTVYRVIAPAPPLPSAQPLRPQLEDGYLALIRRRGAGPQ